MATQGDKIKYRGYAYVKGKSGGGDIDEGKVKEIINTYIVQDSGSATDKLMSQKAVTDAINDTDVGSLKTRMTTAENNITTNKNNITTNTNNIATNTTNINTNTTNIDLNKQSITLEQTARKSADDTLQTNINNEATTRNDKDTELLGKINVNKGNIDIVNNSLTVLQDSFNTHKSEFDEAVRTINSTIATEQTTRQSKDSQLEAKITALEANVQVEVVDVEPPTPEENTLYFIKQDDGSYIRRMYSGGAWHDMGNTEIDLSNYYTKSETYTQTEIDNKVQVNTTDIASEKITRANADTTLLQNINTEVDSREAADTTLQTNIDNEATARTNADNNLQTQITNNDTDIATNKTNIETNTTNITTNTTNIATNTTDITNLKNNKQDKLTAGDGINIDSSNNIKAQVKKLKVGPDETEQTLTGEGTITMPHLYMHTFSFGQSSYMLIGATMFNNSETAIGKSGLINWLSTNGFTSLNNVYPLTTGVTGVNTYYVAASSGGATTTRSFISVAATGLYVSDSALKCKSNFNGSLTLDDTYYGLIEEKIFKIY